MDVWVAEERLCLACLQVVRRWRTAWEFEERSEDVNYDNFKQVMRIEKKNTPFLFLGLNFGQSG